MTRKSLSLGILVMMLLFGLIVTNVYADNYYSTDGVSITWGSTWVHFDNRNTNGVYVNFAVKLSNGRIERFDRQPIRGNTPWQWNTPRGVTIEELLSVSVQKR
jgi:hypothetical protein